MMNSSTSPILIFDVMSTLVYDPILSEIPDFFGLSLRELYAAKHPTAWVDFEHGEIDEETFYRIYFPDRPEPIDGDGLRDVLYESYRWIDGVEPLITTLHERGHEMHILSNYPVWYRIIEKKLRLSRFLSWSFVSCDTGLRKPDKRAYLNAADVIGVAPDRCLFVDDRKSNCEAARQTGMDAVVFQDATHLADELAGRGITV